MNKIKFTKMVASGNDFIIIEGKLSGNLSRLTKALCDRRFGIGADGVLLLDKCKNADLSMRIFNADGSEAQMCGNGARCAAYVIASNSMVSLRGVPPTAGRRSNLKKRDCFAPAGLAMTIKTKAGVINAKVCGNLVKIQLTTPKDIKLDIPLKVNNRQIKVNFINTGVSHVVVFVNGIDGIDVKHIGRSIRNHQVFSPRGTNVNFVEPMNKNIIRVRTYERGVEDETLACGTGSAACAILYAIRYTLSAKIDVVTKSQEILKVYFKREGNKFKDVWLEGSARIVYKGEYYV
ncbi:MAG: diaminopimelate epimerase [Candidatus Omnitrophica bacterium]|nr:diaminopimelate epimerase [Candidatus Omnitrophota bacterium]